jgi:hypothetical protein
MDKDKVNRRSTKISYPEENLKDKLNKLKGKHIMMK